MDIHVRQARTLLMALPAIALLSACGGGGGDSGTAVPSTPVAINASNAATVAGTAAGDTTSTYEVGNLGTDLALGAITRQTRHFRLLPFARRQLGWLQRTNMAMTPPGVTALSISIDVPCDNSNGTARVTLNDTDNDSRASSGDSFSIAFDNCFDNLDQSTTTGSMSLVLNQLTGNPDTDPAWNADITVTLNNLTISDNSGKLSLSGDFTITISTVNSIFFSGTIAGNSLAINENGVSEILSAYNLSFTSDEASLGTAYTIDANGTVASTALDGSVQFQTLTTFEGVDPDYPQRGVMRITGVRNSSVTLTAIDSTDVQLAVDADGDGVSDQTITTQWALIDS